MAAGLAVGLLTAVAAPVALAQSPSPVEPPRQITVRATPIESFSVQDPARRQFGSLEFRGGLVLNSPDKKFGGYSGLLLSPDGTSFIAVGDRGTWLRGRIVYRDGAPQEVTDAEFAPILGPDGRPLAERGWYDTEALAADGGTLYVGIERVHQIVRFDFGKSGLLAWGEPIAVPAEIKALPHNKGLEALAFVPKGSLPLAGTLIAISERGLDKAGNILGFLIGGAHAGQFSIKRTDDYDVSDAAVLLGGDLLVLERRFSPARGVAIRIRRIAHASVRPGATVDGRVLIEADLGYQIDNMEGLAVHRNAQGETILTLISDDNFSPIQRTILLQFVLLAD